MNNADAQELVRRVEEFIRELVAQGCEEWETGKELKDSQQLNDARDHLIAYLRMEHR